MPTGFKLAILSSPNGRHSRFQPPWNNSLLTKDIELIVLEQGSNIIARGSQIVGDLWIGHREGGMLSRRSSRWCDEILSQSRRSSRCSDWILSPPEYLLYRSSRVQAVFGLILGEIPDSCWEGIRIRVIYVSLRDTLHVFVICGDRVRSQ